MQKVSKAESKIDQLVSRRTLTSEGRDWLVTALDPFHDLDHQVAGYPDADSTHTTVSCYQYAVDVGKPASVTTATWDAHVFSMPFSNVDGTPIQFVGGTLQAEHTYETVAAAPPHVNLGMVNIRMENTGLPLFPTTLAEAASVTAAEDFVQLNHQFDGTVTRIIGMAMEVVDTTADVYKQGSVTVYRLPQNARAQTISCYDAANATLSLRAGEMAYRAPPSSAANALKLVGSRQWAARDGCYALVTQNTVSNPLGSNQSSFVRVENGALSTVASAVYLSPGDPHGHLVPAPPAAAILSPAEMVQLMPLNTTGIMLCGLNANSTFRLKVKMIVESAPAPWQSDLVVLASPSAPYDPVALEAYSKALSSLPVGVPASENGLGDWFAGLADIVSKIALPVSTALTPFFPMAPVVGGAVGSAAGFFKNMIAGQKKNDALYPVAGKLALAGRALSGQVARKKKNTKPSAALVVARRGAVQRRQ